MKAFCVAAALIATVNCSSQTLAGNIAAVNEVFGGTVVLKQDRIGQLVFGVYDGGNKIREDIVLPIDLDTALVHYSPEENAVIIGCSAERPQCIRKEIFKLNAIRTTGRSNFPCAEGDPGGVVATKALRELIAAAGEQMVYDETRGRTKRMK